MAVGEALRDRYDDGGFSGGTLDRPALTQLIADIEAGLIDVVVVYKIDRLSRALMDFSKLVEIFDRNGVTFVSVIRRTRSGDVHAEPPRVYRRVKHSKDEPYEALLHKSLEGIHVETPA